MLGAAINAAADAARTADVAVDFAPVVQQAQRIRELASRGGVMPKAVRNMLQYADKGERITFDVARDFSSNISRLSANEFQKLTPALQREIVQLRSALGNALQAGAEQAGKGAEYAGGLKEYASAKKAEDMREMLWKLLKAGIASGGVGGAFEAGRRKIGSMLP